MLPRRVILTGLFLFLAGVGGCDSRSDAGGRKRAHAVHDVVGGFLELGLRIAFH